MDRNSPQFRRGIKEERREHPELPDYVIEMLVSDHIFLHPKTAYKK